jgi:sugar O-acyltransferase (sialic acid O-acetyltransferase NeuD family)
MKKNELVLFGGGGHCKSCIDVIEQEGNYKIAGIADIPEKLHSRLLGYEVFATDNDIPQLIKRYRYFLITIGQIRSPQQRIDLFKILKKKGAKFPVIISPLAHVSKHATVEEGTIVLHHALVNADARIGKNSIINSKALIEHDAYIADHCHISTGASINGGAMILEGSFIGSNAVIRENIQIGKYSKVSAGSLVMKDVPPESTFY